MVPFIEGSGGFTYTLCLYNKRPELFFISYVKKQNEDA